MSGRAHLESGAAADTRRRGRGDGHRGDGADGARGDGADGARGDGADGARGAARRLHGHVIPRPDGDRTRCGGPRLCGVCAEELAIVNAARAAERDCAPCQETLAAVHVAVLRALEISGKRLVTRNRHRRGETRHVPPHLRHALTIVPVTEEELDRLLEDAWALLPEAIPHRGDVTEILQTADTYVRQLLLAGEPHRMEYLAAAFDRAGIPR